MVGTDNNVCLPNQDGQEGKAYVVLNHVLGCCNAEIIVKKDTLQTRRKHFFLLSSNAIANYALYNFANMFE